MKFLLVEDDHYKSKAILEFMRSKYLDASIELAESLTSGLFKLEEDLFDLVLLDMSMPSFDVSEKDPRGGVPESFAGEEFLSHMHLTGMSTPVIVVTQYDNFGPDDKQMSLEQLEKSLAKEYCDIYVGSVYFTTKSDSWKRSLNNILKEIL